MISAPVASKPRRRLPMIRLTLILLGGASLFFVGCNLATNAELLGPAADAAQADTDTKRSDEKPGQTEEAQTGVVRALVETLDKMEGEDADEVKGDLKRSLLDSDKELRGVLGDNSKRRIMEANKKPPALVIGGAPKPGAQPGKAGQPGKAAQPGKADQPKKAEKPKRAAARSRRDAATTGPRPAPVANGEAKTRIVRSLLDLIDEIKGETQEVKDELKRSLLEADDQLSQILGGNSKRLIMAANKKPPIPVIGGPVRPVAQASEPRKPEGEAGAEPGPAESPAEPPPSAEAPAPAQPDEPQTPIVRSLLQVIDELKGEDQDIKDELRRSLLDADKELRQVLGDNSKRKIMRANKKPPVPVVVPDRPARTSPKETKTTAAAD